MQRIETGEVTLNSILDPQVHIKSDILYEASNGWTIKISNWRGEFGVDFDKADEVFGALIA